MSFVKKQFTLAAAVAAAIAAPTAVYATNGMNMEGYGPIATGMGGASMAYDNGTAAVMNNPATLGLAPEGNRLDVAVGILAPNVSGSSATGDEDSSANQFLMPALGWSKKAGKMSYGVGLFSQGGMGTEFDNGGFMTGAAWTAPGADNSYSGQTVRSEVGVGRLIAPFTYDIDDKLTVGGSVDFVWAGMDLQMDLSGQQFFDMMATGSQKFGTVSGSMMTAFNGMMGMMDGDGQVNWGRFDFSDSSDFTGEAQGNGFAGKLGATFKVNSQLTLGATYHTKTSLGDLTTSDAQVIFDVNFGAAAGDGALGDGTEIPVAGEIEVKDFQWPSTLALGAAFQVNDRLMLAADYKRINWAEVMKEFKMTFTADAAQVGAYAPGFANTVMDATFIQEWDDQNVLMLGGSYKVTDPLTLRAGLNLANNPVPDDYLNPLFPAIVQNHLTLGVGYAINPASTVDASLTIAPEVTQDSDWNNVEMSHSQINWQFMYSYRF